MTKTTDKQLDRWLDTFKVDNSPARLTGLEERIMLSLPLNRNGFFQTLSFKDGMLAALGATCVAAGVLWIDYLVQNSEATSYVLASTYMYGGF